MKRYNIINNTLGWFCFVVAAITYLLTIEPTASFWDCPEFITQGYKLEVGHPPGNPIFMLTARFFVTLFGGTAQIAAVAVNSMSALLSAATILLLFWTITHLVRKLIVRPGDEISSLKTLLIMGAGLCGSLAYTWSDTFWFSAVEGEVYAFSLFCTALVFWLILKWENRADNPGSDRYLILIAYIIGISIAVHLLNLLCIPAIVLVIYYRKFKNTNVVGSLIALAVSAAIVALILFGLVPGFVSVAQRFELFFVNTLGMSYNIGVLVYAILTVAVFIWTIFVLRQQKSAAQIKLGVLLSVILSGMPFIGHGWFIPTVLIIALIVYLYGYCKQIPVRIFNIIILSIFVIFIGYSSYALLLIRASANTPMNQNAPDNVFALGSYLNREQYGESPLLYGPKMSETVQYSMAQDGTGNLVEYVEVDEEGNPIVQPVVVGPRLFTEEGSIVDKGDKKYTKVVKGSPDEPDKYVREIPNPQYVTPSGMSTLLPRMYSDLPAHVSGYKSWSLYSPDMTVYAPQNIRERWAQQGYVERAELESYMDVENKPVIFDPVAAGNSLSLATTLWQPSFWDNMKYFFNYQLSHMYWRYFMWNFAGRQNDIQGNGEPHLGNWISGIPFLDNMRLGDQSELPEEYTTANKGHNVFYMLPLLLGILGLLWQALMRHPGGEKRGIEQFWVVFFLFFMTGVAIVLYLNQTPGQPRERDYAFAGSFYAFAIWIGLGVPAIYAIVRDLLTKKVVDKAKKTVVSRTEPSQSVKWVIASCAVAIGIIVPIQMVSQTWDDHDRSNRYAARDFGMNYLNSLDDNAIIFVNGDNDTFPLWYAQEVEGVRPDVKVVNMSYLSQDWYARQVASKTYTADGVPFYMPFTAMDYGNTPYYAVPSTDSITHDITFKDMMTATYKAGKRPVGGSSYYLLGGSDIGSVYVPLSRETLLKRFGAMPNTVEEDAVEYKWDISPTRFLVGGSPSQFANLVAYDIIGRSASEGFQRPVYFASTVGDSYYMGFTDNMYSTGMAKQITPFSKRSGNTSPVAAKAYDNIVGKFRWGGIDSGKTVYLDETIRRMVSSTRLAILDVVNDLLATPDEPAPQASVKVSSQKGLPAPKTYADMAANLLNYMAAKLPAKVVPYENGLEYEVAKAYLRVGQQLNDVAYPETAKAILSDFVKRVQGLMAYRMTLTSGMQTNLLRNETRNLYYVLTALSMINYADIEIAAIKGTVPKDELSPELFDTLCDINGLDYQIGLLLGQASREDLSQFGDHGQYFIDILDLYDKAGVKPYDGVNSFMKGASITQDQWVSML